MPDLEAQIRDVIIGDNLTIRRTIDRVESGFEPGVVIAQAWFTCKAAFGDADPGLFQKDITTTDVPGEGEIENDGTGDLDPIVRFDIGPADTTAIGTALRPYDIQLKTTSGEIYTPELGLISCCEQVTVATT